MMAPTADGPWRLTPEGAAVNIQARVAVVADVHLGYEWARARGGDIVPAHSLAETIGRLDALLGRINGAVDRLVVAGDLVESARFCPRTHRDVASLRRWMDDRAIGFEWLRGNHDPPRRPPLPDRLDLGHWTVHHGDRKRDDGVPQVVGHHHPALRVAGLSAPCFLVAPDLIVLPAFSPNAAGFNVATGALPEALRGRLSLRCIASTGDDLLDFGPVAELASRLAS